MPMSQLSNIQAASLGATDYEQPGQRPRLLVTGASGFLGSEICHQAVAAYEVYGLSHSRALPETLATWRSRIDLGDAELLTTLFRQFRPQLLIHCAAMSSPDACEQDPEASARVTIQSTRLLAALCAETGCRLIFTSTDLVFDGRAGHYDEAVLPCPINVYGRHKVAAEEAITESACNSLICRLPLLFGYGRLQRAPLAYTIERWAAAETVIGFSDEYRSTISYAAAARGILQLAHVVPERPSRLLHLGGLQTVSRYDFLRQLGDRLRHFCEQRSNAETHHRKSVHPALCKAAANAAACTRAGLRHEASLLAARPADVSLDSRAARSFDLRMPFLENQLDAVLNCYDETYDQK